MLRNCVCLNKNDLNLVFWQVELKKVGQEYKK